MWSLQAGYKDYVLIKYVGGAVTLDLFYYLCIKKTE